MKPKAPLRRISKLQAALLKENVSIPLTFFIFVLIVVAIYFGYQYWQPLQQYSQSQPTPTTISDSTTHWKTYTNTDYLYLLKYPPNIILDEIGGGQPPFTEEYLSKVLDLRLLQNNLQLLQVSVSSISNKSLYNEAKSYYALVTDKASENVIIKSLQQVKFLDKDAISYTTYGKFHKTTSTEGYIDGDTPHTYRYIWIDNNNFRYVLLLTETPLSDQMLLTFKFTD